MRTNLTPTHRLMDMDVSRHDLIWRARPRVVLLLLSLAIAVQGCTERPRSNPFDPRNPQAIVRPTDVRIISEDRDVLLTWKPVRRSDISHYTVYRQGPGDSDFRALATVPPSVTEYRDRGLLYNQEYLYQLSYTTPQGESERSEPVSIIPGPNSKWVLDTAAARLIKLTFDTRHLILRGPSYFRPLAMVTSRRDRSVWVGEGLADFVDKVSSDGTVQLRIGGVDEPIDLAINQITGDCWFFDARARALGRIDPLGRSVVAFTSERFTEKMRVSVNSLTGEVWLADLSGDTIFRLSPSGVVLNTYTIPGAPGVLAVSVADNALWVSDVTNHEILKISAIGEVVARTGGFAEVVDLAVNEVTGDCWVVERSLSPPSGRVIRLSAEGERLLSLDDFRSPTSIAVDLFDNSIVVGDVGRSSVRRISENGEILGEFTDVVSPRMVGID